MVTPLLAVCIGNDLTSFTVLIIRFTDALKIPFHQIIVNLNVHNTTYRIGLVYLTIHLIL